MNITELRVHLYLKNESDNCPLTAHAEMVTIRFEFVDRIWVSAPVMRVDKDEFNWNGEKLFSKCNSWERHKPDWHADLVLSPLVV